MPMNEIAPKHRVLRSRGEETAPKTVTAVAVSTEDIKRANLYMVVSPWKAVFLHLGPRHPKQNQLLIDWLVVAGAKVRSQRRLRDSQRELMRITVFYVGQKSAASTMSSLESLKMFQTARLQFPAQPQSLY